MIYCYSLSDIHSYHEELCGDFYIFPNLVDLSLFLKRHSRPCELLKERFRWRAKSYEREKPSGNHFDLKEIIYKIELPKEELDKIENYVEEVIGKQEKSDLEYMRNNPKELFPPRFSGVCVPNRADKQKYIDAQINNSSWKWKF